MFISKAPTKFILPDLFSYCDFELHMSSHLQQVTVETKEWLFKNECLSEKKRQSYHGLKSGYLAAACYPNASFPHLRVCSDFLTYVFHLDNLSDDMDRGGTSDISDVIMNSLYWPETYTPTARIGTLTRDYWRRMIRTASPIVQQRFIESLDFFLQSIADQARDRTSGVIPDLESYIAMRRDTSGSKSSYVLIEYANNLDIPEEVIDSDIVRGISDACNDWVTWTNDLFSYNVEQSKGDTHNMVAVVMHEKECDVQTAVDFVGDLCKDALEKFKHDRTQLPSWGPDLDRQVQIYIDGLQEWMIGSLHWSFNCERYFGKDGPEIMKSRVVHLLPRQV